MSKNLDISGNELPLVINRLHELTIPELNPERCEEAISTYDALWKKLSALDSGLDVGRGYVNWLRGNVLLRIKKYIPHGEWGKFLQRHNISRSTSWLLRAIAESISEKEAKQLGYDEIRARVCPSFGKAMEKQPTLALEQEEPTESDNGKEPVSGDSSDSASTSAKQEPGIESLPLSLAKFLDKFTPFLEHLSTLPLGVKKEYRVASCGALKTARLRINDARRLLDELEGAVLHRLVNELSDVLESKEQDEMQRVLSKLDGHSDKAR